MACRNDLYTRRPTISIARKVGGAVGTRCSSFFIYIYVYIYMMALFQVHQGRDEFAYVPGLGWVLFFDNYILCSLYLWDSSLNITIYMFPTTHGHSQFFQWGTHHFLPHLYDVGKIRNIHQKLADQCLVGGSNAGEILCDVHDLAVWCHKNYWLYTPKNYWAVVSNISLCSPLFGEDSHFD